MLIFEYPFWIISIDQCIKQKNAIDNKIHRNYQTEIIPYCSGRWSRTKITMFNYQNYEHVLILIVVDDGLVLITMETTIITANVS